MLAAPVAEIRLGGTQVVPVGLRLHADSFDGDELALDAEQALDDALRLLVASFAEVLVADDAVRVDEVERRPVAVVEGAPDFEVVVDRDRVVDPPLRRRLPNTVDVVLERELRRVDSDDDQPSSRYACDHAGTHGSWRSQLMHVSVQKSTSTTRPRSSAGPSGPGLSHPGAPPSGGTCP